MTSKGLQSLASKLQNPDCRPVSISELEDLGDHALGLQLLVECHEATYFGVLNFLLKDKQRKCIWLEKVCIPKSGDKRLIGLKKLYPPNILSIKMIGVDVEIQKRLLKKMGSEKKHSKPLVMKQIVYTENFDAEDDTEDHDIEAENEHPINELSFLELLEQINLEVPRYKNNPRPCCLKVIDKAGNEFQGAASHVYLHMQEHKNQVPYLIKSLSALLQEYFGLTPKLLALMFPEVGDESVWLERPLSNALQNTLTFSVLFLRELRQCLLDLIFVDLQQVNNIFVDSFIRKTASEIQQLEENVVPYEIHQLGKPAILDQEIFFSKGKPMGR